jgi:nitrite reductase (NADH) small subunit/3-phenylpropionate/trans-cinnamate dioxygenase ferredoxin subunit
MESESKRPDSREEGVAGREKIAVGAVGDLPAGRSATVELSNGDELALYNVGGQFFAVENFCPHRGAPLADGILCEYTVECILHGWEFEVRTGKCLTTDADIRAYEVEIEDGQINILIDPKVA